MRIEIYPILPFLLLFTFSLGTQAQVKKNIQPVFYVGEQFEWKNTIFTDVFDEEQPTYKEERNYTLTLNIVGKDASGKVMMRAQYIRISDICLSIVKKDTAEYDSVNPDAPIKTSNEEFRKLRLQYRKFRGAMLKKPFTIYFNERSGSVAVTGIDTLVTESLKKMTFSDAADRDGFSKGVRTFCNNEEWTRSFEAAFNYIPGKPVGAGDGYTKNINIEKLDDAKLKFAYIIESVQPDSISIQAVAGPEVINEHQLAISKKGNLTIDAKTGLLVKSAMRTEVKSVPTSKFWMIKTERNELVRVKQ